MAFPRPLALLGQTFLDCARERERERERKRERERERERGRESVGFSLANLA